jgi:ABC-type sugar transport system permease subunit
MAAEKTATLAPRTSESAKKGDDSLRYLPWLFLAPSLVIYTIVVVYPMVYSSYLSLFRWDGVAPTKVFVGLDNYGILLTQSICLAPVYICLARLSQLAGSATREAAPDEHRG